MNYLTKTRPFYTPTGRAVDLHDTAVDATGKLDALVARSLRLVVETHNDPVLAIWYSQFQPFIDCGFSHLLSRYNVAKTLRMLGIAPPPKKAKRKGQEQTRSRRGGKVL